MNADERRSEAGGLPEEEARLRDAVMIYGGLILCEACSREACPEAPIFTDEEYEAAARRLWVEGWRAVDEVHVYCPKCSTAEAMRKGGG